MAGEASDTSWLDAPATAVAEQSDDWLSIEDPNAGSTTAAFRHLIDACMRGTNRVMACNGQHLAYRPFNREFDKEVNPRTQERMAMFLEAGYYRHVGTYDEVQIYELMPGNPYRHDKKQYVIGQDYWKDIRQAVDAACARRWSDYHDILGAMATALKSGRDGSFARTVWADTVNQVTVQIEQRRQADPSLPTEKEVNEGFVEVRRARGIRGQNGVVLLNSSQLEKVEFTKGGA